MGKVGYCSRYLNFFYFRMSEVLILLCLNCKQRCNSNELQYGNILPELTDFQIVQRGNGLQVLPGTTPVTFSMAHRHALLLLELEFIGIGSHDIRLPKHHDIVWKKRCTSEKSHPQNT